MIEPFCQIYLCHLNVCCLAWNRQQDALVSTWTKLKQSSCVFNKISTLNDKPMKFVDQFTYLGSNISSTERDVNVCIRKAFTVIDKLSILWKSDLSSETKCEFIQALAVLVLLYGCTMWTLIKCSGKNLDREIHKDAACCFEQHSS